MTNIGYLFTSCNVGSFRMQRILMKKCSEMGRPFQILSVAATDKLKVEVEEGARVWNTHVHHFIDEFPSAPVTMTDRAQAIWWLILSHAKLRGFETRLRLQRARLKAAIELLAALKPSALVVSEDGVSGPIAIITAARRLRIPIIDVPYGNATRIDFENELERRTEVGTLETVASPAGRLVQRLFPQWVKKGKHAGALLFQAEHILSVEAVGMTLRDAWVVHGGPSDILCVDNRVGRRQYEFEGIPVSKMRDTGSPYCDAVVAGAAIDTAGSANLRKSSRIGEGITRVLVSWPPSYHDTYTGRNEFGSYNEMTYRALNFLATLSRAKVTLSLHPACSDEVGDIARRMGFVPTTDDLLSLIPRNDIFVTYFSSTIRWALAAGKPVVNYDAYRAELPQFNEAPGFINTATFADFKAALTNLVASEAAFARLAAAQIAVSDDWGVLDGKCSERIIAEIDRLVAVRNPITRGANL